MLRCKDLRAFRMDFPIAKSHLIHPIHQLRDKIEIEAGVSKTRDLALGSNNHVRVFNGIIEIVLGHGDVDKLALWNRRSKTNHGNETVENAPNPVDIGFSRKPPCRFGETHRDY